MEENLSGIEIRDKKSILISRIKRRIFKHVWTVRLFLLSLVTFGIYLLVLIFNLILGRLGVSGYTKAISSFLFSPVSALSSIEGRTNILILGKAGQGHTAPDLTDTIIFSSLSLKTAKISMVSLPRDIWVPEIRAKLNSAYYWGKFLSKEKGRNEEEGGLTLAKSTVEEIVGAPIQYGLIIDFSGFKKIVDVLGGAEVEVENSFVDSKYPIVGKENDTCEGDHEFKCRYETIEFKKGKTLMDGELALKFVRSRNAEGDEGTDMARNRRQQKVILAVKNKILKPQILLSPKKVLAIWKVVKEAVETDIDARAGAILARRIISSKDQIKSHVLSEDFLVHPPVSPQYDNQYVFIPKEEDWEKVNLWVRSLLE